MYVLHKLSTLSLCDLTCSKHVYWVNKIKQKLSPNVNTAELDIIYYKSFYLSSGAETISK